MTLDASGNIDIADTVNQVIRKVSSVPLLADLDVDGRADLIVWRASNGTWYWLPSSSGFNCASAGVKQWGASGDVPIIR